MLDSILSVESETLPQDAKLRKLLELLQRLKWKGTKGSPRIVLFAERIETLEYLEGAIQEQFGLTIDGTDEVRGHSTTHAVARFDGSLSDVQQQHVIEDFGRDTSETRLLLTSDAGSQGVNLHYVCNMMINYDLPWSLITLEQRNGRIDRYGQKQTPHIHYILAESDEPGIDTDLRIVDRIREKEDYAYQTLGDAGAITALYDKEAEEKATTEAIATGNTEFLDEQAGQAKKGPTLDELFAKAAAQQNAVSPQPDKAPTLFSKAPITPQSTSLYASDSAYYEALIAYLSAQQQATFQEVEELKEGLYEIERTRDLKDVLFGVPREALASKTVQLSLKPALVMDAIAHARKTDGAWTSTQLLYDGHPLAKNWMQKLAMQQAEGTAPVARLRVLPKGQVHYLFYGQSTNDLGTSLLSEFYTVPVDFSDASSPSAGKPVALAELWATLTPTDEGKLWTDRQSSERDLEALMGMLGEAVENGKEYYLDSRLDALRQNMQRQESEYRMELDAWYGSAEILSDEDYQALSRPEQRAYTSYAQGRERYARYTTMRAGTHVQVLGVWHNL